MAKAIHSIHAPWLLVCTFISFSVFTGDGVTGEGADKHGDVNMAFQHSDGGGGGDSAPCGLFFVVYLKIEIIFKQLRHP